VSHPWTSMEETVTALHCTGCSRTGRITRQGAGFWCAWCGGACEVELRATPVITRETADRFTTDGQLVDPEDAPLQPLRIPAGWTVEYNNGLFEVDPTERTVQWWWLFKSDMLMLRHPERNRLLDLGWRPEGDFEDGAYRLRLYEGDCAGAELHAWEGRDRVALVREIEHVLKGVVRRAL
jgi:hypothetical protein